MPSLPLDSLASAPRGILPSLAIDTLLTEGAIMSTRSMDPSQVQPASLDVRLGPIAYRVRASFLPGNGIQVSGRLEDLALHRISLQTGAVLEVGCVYIIPLLETLHLPAFLSASANPKSSTGRLDIFTRLITDGADAFDTVPKGYQGPLYLEVSPRTFPIVVREGSRLSQIRFRVGHSRLCDEEVQALHARDPLLSSGKLNLDQGLGLRVDLHPKENGAPVGYRALRHCGVIDVDRVSAYGWQEFWEPIFKPNHLILDPGEFYILASQEAVRIPPDHAAEMVPFNPLVGEFRVHYAGFFDPGFGHHSGKGEGSRAVLEVRSHDVPFILEHGQMIGRLIYEPLLEPPPEVYGHPLGSHYQGQGLKLSKHFR